MQQYTTPHTQRQRYGHTTGTVQVKHWTQVNKHWTQGAERRTLVPPTLCTLVSTSMLTLKPSI